MKPGIKIIVMFFFLLILLSCNKKEQYIRTKVYGVIKDYYSEQPIANATVGVYRNNSFYNPYVDDTVATTLTNSDGEYEIKFHARKEDGYSYGVYVSKEPEGYNESSIATINKKHSNECNYSVKGRAWLCVHVKNISPYNEQDYIKISAWPASSGHIAYGVNVDTNYFFYAKGSNDIHIGWFVKKNSIIQYYADTIYCPSLDTTYFTIYY